jgi:hypothetical protein
MQSAALKGASTKAGLGVVFIQTLRGEPRILLWETKHSWCVALESG